MTDTERKYYEARYFFQKLDIDDPYFDFNLSAFLNAARSVMWVMRHEFNKIDGWENWFQEYYLPQEQHQLLKEINDLRIESTKKSGIKTDFFFLQTDMFVDEKYYPELDRINQLEDGEYILSIEPLPADETNIRKGEINFVGEINRERRQFDDNRSKLKGKCEEYLKLIDIIINACLEKFIAKN